MTLSKIETSAKALCNDLKRSSSIRYTAFYGGVVKSVKNSAHQATIRMTALNTTLKSSNETVQKLIGLYCIVAWTFYTCMKCPLALLIFQTQY